MKKEKKIEVRAKAIGLGEVGNARSRNILKYSIRIQTPRIENVISVR